jgi:hypothetical protein
VGEAAGLGGVVGTQLGGGLSAAAHLQLLKEIMHVVLDRGGTDRQLARDFLVGAALVRQRQDHALALGEGRQLPLRLRLAK